MLMSKFSSRKYYSSSPRIITTKFTSGLDIHLEIKSIQESFTSKFVAVRSVKYSYNYFLFFLMSSPFTSKLTAKLSYKRLSLNHKLLKKRAILTNFQDKSIPTRTFHSSLISQQFCVIFALGAKGETEENLRDCHCLKQRDLLSPIIQVNTILFSISISIRHSKYDFSNHILSLVPI